MSEVPPAQRRQDLVVGGEDSEPVPLPILIVDDDDRVRMLLQAFLDEFGLASVAVSSGEAGLRELGKRDFSVCLLDLHLPGMDGPEVFANARVTCPDLPVVVVTGYAEPQMLDQMLSHGPIMIMKKPLRAKDLRHALTVLGLKIDGAAV